MAEFASSCFSSYRSPAIRVKGKSPGAGEGRTGGGKGWFCSLLPQIYAIKHEWDEWNEWEVLLIGKGNVVKMRQGVIEESLQGIVERVTYHNAETGWSVLQVKCFQEHEAVTVTVHQTRVFAGATMKFFGSWGVHSTYGRQFKAVRAEEQKPATAAGLEKYLGSGLIKGVGPKTARRIVGYFGKRTLDIFEERIEDLLLVPGIAHKKLAGIKTAWEEHRAVREVMLFLQGHGISTLFAVRIYKKYGDQAVSMVQENPYRLADDFYGIGFFSADKVALSLGIALDSELRIIAAIRHILAASREQGHCFLTGVQIQAQVKELLEMDLGDRLAVYLHTMERDNLLKTRFLALDGSDAAAPVCCYYSKTLYYDELKCAQWFTKHCGPLMLTPSGWSNGLPPTAPPRSCNSVLNSTRPWPASQAAAARS